MKFPNFSEEKKLHKKGFKTVAGLDEAGRGPLAGPVVAAAVIINSKYVSDLDIRISDLEVRDSKQMSAKQREEIYEKIIKCKDIVWGIGIVSEKVIDKINILQATKLAMKKALRQAQGKPNLNADFLLIDGNFKINSDIPQLSIIKGDQKVFSIAAASIIAKVTRDRIMQKAHKKYPQYGFNRNKGYGTKAHFASIELNGPCQIHRKTFYPVSSYVFIRN